jgi:hypothetical protein
MARHKRKTKKHHTRRRSHKSGMGAIDFTNILGVVAGAVAAGYLDKLVPDSVNPKIVAGGKIALGVALPMFVKSGSMKNVLAGAGAGMVAVGSVDLLKGFGVLSGAAEDDVLEISLNGDMDVLSGDDMSVINASVLAEDDMSVINGYDEESDEY